MLYCKVVGKVSQGAGSRPYVKVETDEATGERIERWQMRSISVSGRVFVGSQQDVELPNLLEHYDYCDVSEMPVLAISNMDVSLVDGTLLFNKLAAISEGDHIEAVGSFVLRNIRGRKVWSLSVDDVVVTAKASPRTVSRMVHQPAQPLDFSALSSKK